MKRADRGLKWVEVLGVGIATFALRLVQMSSNTDLTLATSAGQVGAGVASQYGAIDGPKSWAGSLRGVLGRWPRVGPDRRSPQSEET